MDRSNKEALFRDLMEAKESNREGRWGSSVYLER